MHLNKPLILLLSPREGRQRQKQDRKNKRQGMLPRAKRKRGNNMHNPSYKKAYPHKQISPICVCIGRGEGGICKMAKMHLVRFK